MSEWDTIGYIVSSQHRIDVVSRLAKSPATPSTIAEDRDHEITHVSRALKALREKDLVELLVPEERRKGRVYGLTATGTKIWEKMEAQDIASGTEAEA